LVGFPWLTSRNVPQKMRLQELLVSIVGSWSDRTAIPRKLDEWTASTTCNLTDGGTVRRCFSTEVTVRKEVQTTRILGLSCPLGVTDSEFELFHRRMNSRQVQPQLSPPTRSTLHLCDPAKKNLDGRYERSAQLSEGSRTGNTSK
jgi:hypothetical protein